MSLFQAGELRAEIDSIAESLKALKVVQEQILTGLLNDPGRACSPCSAIPIVLQSCVLGKKKIQESIEMRSRKVCSTLKGLFCLSCLYH